MNKSNLTGIVPILLTPFDDNDNIDKNSLCSEIDYCIDSGVNGLGIALGSEIFKLNEKERYEILKIVLDHTNNQIPIIINTSSFSTKMTIENTKQAKSQGAYAVMIMPQFFMPLGQDEILEYYNDILKEVNIPTILQDIPQSPITTHNAEKIFKENANAKYIKVESLPTVPKIKSMSERFKNDINIFGGAGGNYFLEELKRGACGTMPFASQSKEFIDVYNKYKSDKIKEAHISFNKKIAPINRLSSTDGDKFFYMHKQILVKKGIIKNSFVRKPTVKINNFDKNEIDQFIEDIL